VTDRKPVGLIGIGLLGQAFAQRLRRDTTQRRRDTTACSDPS
jgi:hypothetical protein